MKGLQLRSLSGELYGVAPAHAEKPVNAIEAVEEKLGPWKRYARGHCGENFSFLRDYHRLLLRALAGFSFDELCKLHYSSAIMMDDSVDKLFERDARYEVVRKIESSMWRWGVGKGTWNEVVSAYDCIRHFSFVDDPDFEIRLDYTRHYNEFGHAKYSRTFIDGVFAYLVYYKKKHVMTIGFSLMEKKRLLIQQVQLANRTGNRFLYKLPNNRLEFVIDLFRKNFPGYRLHVIDGDCLAEKTLADYRRSLAREREHCRRYRNEARSAKGESKELNARWLAQSEQERAAFEEKIAHLTADRQRLISFYGTIGRFSFGIAPIKVNGLVHHRVTESSVSQDKKRMQYNRSL